MPGTLSKGIHKKTGPNRVLTLFDAVSIIVGTIIGAGIFQAAPFVAKCSGDFYSLIGLWLFGGLLTIVGALCFAELTTRFKDLPGGDYGYLKLAYGRPIAFMFAWATFWIIRPGNIGAMALTFAFYFDQIVQFNSIDEPTRKAIYAVLAVLILSGTNLIGLKQGKWLQNLLTVAKVAGLVAIVALAFFLPGNAAANASETIAESNSNAADTNWLLAMVFIMFSFGGWNDLAFVATEIKNPERNLFRSLIFGSLAVTAIYVVVNIAFVSSLGFSGVAASEAVATDVVSTTLGTGSFFGRKGSQIIAALVCISCLGAINGIIITSPRIYYAAGRDFNLIRAFGRWDNKRDQPWLATAIQAVVTIGLFCLCFRYKDPFNVIVVASAPFFWTFLGLAGLSLIVLRIRRPINREERKFRVPLYPVEPIVLALTCFLMAYSSTQHLIAKGYWIAGGVVVGLMVLGIGLGLILRPFADNSSNL